MSDGFNACATSKNVVLRCLVVVGNRDHFGHFFLDFLLPVYHWLYTRGRLYDEDMTVYFVDQKIEVFRPIINRFFHCRVVTKFTPEQVRGCYRDLMLGMEGHNRRILNLSLEEYIGNPRQYIKDLRGYAYKKLGLDVQEPNQLVLVNRKLEAGDRGGGRRVIANHDEVRAALQVLASKEGLQFVDAVLEDMDFQQQAQLFTNASVVVGQHGAGLCHSFWMQDGGILQELGNTDKEVYRFAQFCHFFKHVSHAHMKCAVKKSDEKIPGTTSPRKQDILVPVDELSGSLQQAIQRRGK